MASKSKTKGKTFEREVCKILKKFFNLNFERVPASGAFTGGINKNVLERLTESQILLSEGDIIVPEELTHIKIECKSYKQFSWNACIHGEYALIDKWIEQAKEGSTNRHWFLIFKINNQGRFIVFDQKLFDVCQKPKNMLFYKNYIVTELESFVQNNINAIKNGLRELPACSS